MRNFTFALKSKFAAALIFSVEVMAIRVLLLRLPSLGRSGKAFSFGKTNVVAA